MIAMCGRTRGRYVYGDQPLMFDGLRLGAVYFYHGAGHQYRCRDEHGRYCLFSVFVLCSAANSRTDDGLEIGWNLLGSSDRRRRVGCLQYVPFPPRSLPLPTDASLQVSEKGNNPPLVLREEFL